MSVSIHIDMHDESEAAASAKILKAFIDGMGGGITETPRPSEDPVDIKVDGSAGDLVEKVMLKKETPTKTKNVEDPDKEKVISKKQRRKIATERADELGIEWDTKTGTAAIEARVKAAEKKDHDTGGKDEPDPPAADKKKKGKASKKTVKYNEKKTKELCVFYVNELPGELKDKKEALYVDILQKFGGGTKMSEVMDNGNIQIVGEVLAAHIAYHTVAAEVSEDAATSAMVLIANVEDLTEVPPMLHTPLTEALNVVLEEARALPEE